MLDAPARQAAGQGRLLPGERSQAGAAPGGGAMSAISVLAIRKLDGNSAVKAFVDIRLGGVTLRGCKIVQQTGARPWLAHAFGQDRPWLAERRRSQQALRERLTAVVLDVWESRTVVASPCIASSAATRGRRTSMSLPPPSTGASPMIWRTPSDGPRYHHLRVAVGRQDHARQDHPYPGRPDRRQGPVAERADLRLHRSGRSRSAQPLHPGQTGRGTRCHRGARQAEEPDRQPAYPRDRRHRAQSRSRAAALGRLRLGRPAAGAAAMPESGLVVATRSAAGAVDRRQTRAASPAAGLSGCLVLLAGDLRRRLQSRLPAAHVALARPSRSPEPNSRPGSSRRSSAAWSTR